MRKRSGGEKQDEIWIAHTELARSPGHPFYERLNEVLESAGFDEFADAALDRPGHASGGVHVGAGIAGGSRAAAGTDFGD